MGNSDGLNRGASELPDTGTQASTAPLTVLKALTAINVAAIIGYFYAAGATSYSYWFDELSSVSVARLPFAEMLRTIFHDFHPPLYQIILNGWVRLVGTDEGATRGLSLFFALAAVAAFTLLRRRMSAAQFWTAFALFTSSASLVAYAQEARNYALLIFLGTLALVFLVENRRTPLLIVVAILGLTHYFGLLLAGAILGYLVLTAPMRTKVISVILGLLLLIWPVSQVLFGSLSDNLGGNFWIDSTPEAAIPQLLSAVFAYLARPIEWVVLYLGLPWATIGVATLVLFLCFNAVLADAIRRRRREDAAFLTKVQVAFFGVLGFAIVINLHTPITTPRNFLVLLPFGAVLMAWLLVPRARAVPAPLTVAIVVVFLAIAHYDTWFQIMRLKAGPFQDWQATTAGAMATQAETGGRIWYYHGNNLADRNWVHEAYGFYLPEGTPYERIRPDSLEQLTPGDVIFFGEFRCTLDNGTLDNGATRMLSEAGIAYDTFLPQQFAVCSTGYLTIR